MKKIVFPILLVFFLVGCTTIPDTGNTGELVSVGVQLTDYETGSPLEGARIRFIDEAEFYPSVELGDGGIGNYSGEAYSVKSTISVTKDGYSSFVKEGVMVGEENFFVFELEPLR